MKQLEVTKNSRATVDGSEIPNNHLGCIKPYEYCDIDPTSIGDRRISEPPTVCNIWVLNSGFF